MLKEGQNTCTKYVGFFLLIFHNVICTTHPDSTKVAEHFRVFAYSYPAH